MNAQIKNNPKHHRRPLYGIIFLWMILSLLLSLCFCFTSCNTPSSDGEDTVTSDDTSPSSEGEDTVTSDNTSADLPVDGKPVDSPKKRVAITFDDGPHNIWTKKIVNELGRYGFTATFFVIGNRVDGKTHNGGDTMAFTASQGHELAIHGYTHKVYYDECTDAEYDFELSETAKVIGQWGNGIVPTLMRPIGGIITPERAAICPYAIINWDVDSEDWRYQYKSEDTPEMMQEKVDSIVNNVMSTVHDGSIILLHDIYESTYDATCIILARLYAEGYEVVSVSELLGEPVPGKIYYNR